MFSLPGGEGRMFLFPLPGERVNILIPSPLWGEGQGEGESH